MRKGVSPSDGDDLHEIRNAYTGIDTGVQTQDMAMVETMGPISDRTKEHLGASDAGIVHWRECVVQAVKAFLAGGTPPRARAAGGVPQGRCDGCPRPEGHRLADGRVVCHRRCAADRAGDELTRDRMVRIGIAGLGRAASGMLPAFVAHPDVAIVALAEPQDAAPRGVLRRLRRPSLSLGG